MWVICGAMFRHVRRQCVRTPVHMFVCLAFVHDEYVCHCNACLASTVSVFVLHTSYLSRPHDPSITHTICFKHAWEIEWRMCGQSILKYDFKFFKTADLASSWVREVRIDIVCCLMDMDAFPYFECFGALHRWFSVARCTFRSQAHKWTLLLRYCELNLSVICSANIITPLVQTTHFKWEIDWAQYTLRLWDIFSNILNMSCNDWVDTNFQFTWIIQ